MELDDEEALLALADGDSVLEAAGREALAGRYYARVVNWLRREFGVRDDVAETAAADALMRLFKKVAADLGVVDPTRNGVLRWLCKVGRDAARDRLEWIRRKQLLALGQDPDIGEYPLESSDDPGPLDSAEHVELAEKVYAVLDALPEPERSILKYDLLGAYHELTGDALDYHDQLLIDASQEHEIYTRDALRARRRRIREKIGPEIYDLLGVHYGE